MSHTNLITINCTEINNSGPLRVGDNLSSGDVGKVLKSNGDYVAPSWEDDIDTTYQGSATIDIDTTTDPNTINVIKVPNDLTFTGYATGTFNGSSALNINLVDTDTTYTAGNGIQISGSNIIQTKTDNQTIRDSGGGSGNNLEVIKVPNDLTFTGYATGTFNGSSALNINLVDTDTTYTAGFGIAFSGTPATQINANTDNTTIDYNGAGYTLRVLKIPNSLSAGNNLSYSSGTTFDGSVARTIDLDSNLSNIDTLSFSSTAGVTALVGNTYPSNPTALLFCDLTSSSNITSPYFLHDVYDPIVTDLDSLTTSFAFIFSSNLKNSFTAQKTSCCIELLIYNYSITGNRFLYLQLGDNVGTEWSVGTSGGGSGTGTRSTTRTTFYTDETDKAQVIQTWYLTGLTIGNTYTINPMASTSATTNYIYAGGSYPACILRGYYLPS